MKLLSSLFLLVLVTVVQWGSLIYGWGMTPQNWTVIIGASIVALMLTVVSVTLGRE
jgi:hypothetical protein